MCFSVAICYIIVPPSSKKVWKSVTQWDTTVKLDKCARNGAIRNSTTELGDPVLTPHNPVDEFQVWGTIAQWNITIKFIGDVLFRVIRDARLGLEDLVLFSYSQAAFLFSHFCKCFPSFPLFSIFFFRFHILFRIYKLKMMIATTKPKIDTGVKLPLQSNLLGFQHR